jgi:hypothetical protein
MSLDVIKSLHKSYEARISNLTKEGEDLKKKLFLAQGGEVTPVRIIHLCDMTGVVDYVDNVVKFESWKNPLFKFKVPLEKYNFFFIQSGKFFKWGAFCFAEKPSETVIEDLNFRFLIAFVEKHNKQSLNTKDLEDAVGLWNDAFDFENIYVESHLKTPYSVSMFSLGDQNNG